MEWVDINCAVPEYDKEVFVFVLNSETRPAFTTYAKLSKEGFFCEASSSKPLTRVGYWMIVEDPRKKVTINNMRKAHNDENEKQDIKPTLLNLARVLNSVVTDLNELIIGESL